MRVRLQQPTLRAINLFTAGGHLEIKSVILVSVPHNRSCTSCQIHSRGIAKRHTHSGYYLLQFMSLMDLAMEMIE